MTLSDVPASKGAKPPYYLKIRQGKFRTSYWVVYRAHGLDIREALKGKFDRWQDAAKAADEIIYKARFGESRQAREMTRCEDIAEQLIAEAKGQDDSTIDGKINIFRNHLLPWLNENYPYANLLTVETWPRYKLYKREINPTIALENHAKYFRMLASRAFDLGLVKPKIPVKFNVKKDDFREAGNVISNEDFAKMLAAADFRKSVNKDGSPSHGQGHRTWYCRMVIQRDTGARPGEVRCLRKLPITLKGGKVLPANVSFPDPGTASIQLFEEETKTDRYREFVVKSPRAVDALLDRSKRYPDSPYLFPMETDHSRPMDKHLGGWKAILARAGVNLELTPHDLRHTYATEMFQRVQNYAALCYQLDMSLETAQGVYLHLSAKDTYSIADAVISPNITRGIRDTNETTFSKNEVK